MKYIIIRVVQLIPVLILATLIVFFTVRLAPGDPALIKLGPRGGSDTAAVEKVHKEMGLDKPIIIQYFYWARDAIRGDFGVSLMNGVDAFKIVKSRIPASFELIVASLLIALTLSILLGVSSARCYGGALDKIISSLSIGLISIPMFWVGLLLIAVFAVNLRILPASGYVSFLENPGMNLKLLIMPAVSLALAEVGVFTRFIRGGMVNVLSSNYIRTAKAKGMPQRRIYLIHGFKNIAVTIVTIIGLEIGTLIGGTLLIEQIFGWSGIGWLLYQSIVNRDYSILQCIVVLVVIAYVLINLIVDIIYVLIDPRVKL